MNPRPCTTPLAFFRTPRSRRGSFLVLVVGTLALLSIIMVVYVAIGSADRRTSASVLRRDRTDEIAGLFADYAKQIVADDAVAMVTDPIRNALNANIYTREAWDFPSIRWTSSSATAQRTDPTFFRPVGSGDDPWLASTTPTHLVVNPPQNRTPTPTSWEQRRDWLQITNIAPDGRFVNLANLRDNFDAQAGTDPGSRRISANLSLTNNLGVAQTADAFSQSPQPEIPAFFTAWQLGAFRPAAGPFSFDPDDPRYPPNQWADTDGDGYFDARWFEMVDARGGGNIATPTQERSLLPRDPNYRWFFAARIIDLSALVNVNTAADLGADPNVASTPASTGPRVGDVVGVSPADVDLRRLLSMRDFRETILDGQAPNSVQITDIDGFGGAVTRPFNGGYSAIRQPGGNRLSLQNYVDYADAPFQAATTGTRPGGGSMWVTPNSAATELGLGAYAALRGALGTGSVPGRFTSFAVDPMRTAARDIETIQARHNLFANATRLTGGATYNISANRFDFGRGFGADSLLELLTYRSVNDPNVTSALETTMTGRMFSTLSRPIDDARMTNDWPLPLSPLRSSRSLELEREFRADASTGGLGSQAAMLQAYTDLRQYLTTLSSARSIVPRLTGATIDLDNPPALSESELPTSVGLDPFASNLFQGYAQALMPGLPPGEAVGSPLDGAWTASGFANRRGLFYGHAGPLPALLISGHMAANLATSARPPTNTASVGIPFTLLLTEQFYNDSAGNLPLNTSEPAFSNWRSFFPAWWHSSTHQLNLGRAPVTTGQRSGMPRISTSVTAEPVPVPAVNVYGTGDLHPFIADVATFTVYRDVPPIVNGQVGGDVELAQGVEPTAFVTINGDLAPTNRDFLFRVLSVKLHNPHPVPIRLSDFTAGSSVATSSAGNVLINRGLGDSFFYLQIGEGADAKYYVLAESFEQRQGTALADPYTGNFILRPIVIRPGETLQLFALSQDARTIVENRYNPTTRFATSNAANTGEFFNQWLTTNLGPESGTNFRRLQMTRVDANFASSNPAGTDSFASFAFDPLVPTSGTDNTVSLRRTVRLDSGVLGNDTGAARPNLVANDQLVDRLRLGTTINLDRRLRGGGAPATRVSGLIANPDPREPSQDARRPVPFTDSNGATQTSYNCRLTVALGAYVRRPGDPAGTTLVPGAIPLWAVDPKDRAASTWYVVEQQPPTGGPGPFQLTAGALDAGGTRTFSTFSDIVWIDPGRPAIFPTLAQRPEQWPAFNPTNTQGVEFDDLRRELASNGNAFQGRDNNFRPNGTSQLRLADLLSVMGVGAVETPIDNSGVAITNPVKRWTTTAEALAIGMGLTARPSSATDWQTPASPYGPLDYYYFDPATTNPRPFFDSGYLRLDDFVPVVFNGPDAFPAGDGVPMAGRILAAFENQLDPFASLTSGVVGRVNVNTAPRPVLKVLPFTAPARDERTTRTFWPGAPTSPTPSDSEREAEAAKTDVAAMIEAYRDKIAVELRPGARNQAGGLQTWFAAFFDRPTPTITNGGQLPPSHDPLANRSQATGGRFQTSGIANIRETPGMRSLGDLLALRHVQFNPTTGAVTAGSTNPSNIDFLGFRTFAQPTNLLGLDSALEATSDINGNVTGLRPLRFGGTFQDRLKILAGLSGSVTVRSDTYAMWFVVRGYQRSDVEGLSAEQPMVPSIERRYLMIIDRSNVTRPGEKPRVVAFVEVPN